MLGIRTVLGASLVFTMTALGIAACSSDDPKPAPPPEEHLDYCDLPTACQEIIDACHRKDLGEEGEVHDCHEVAHDEGTQAGCEAVHDDCVQVCNDTPLPPNAEPEEPWNCGDGGHDH
jgi:hypothetical protein